MRIKATMAVLAVVSAALASAGEEAAKPPELKFLDKFVGTWETETVVKPSAWTPQETRTKGTDVKQLALNGRFLEVKGGPADSPHASMMTYDVQMKAYRFWYFDSTGLICEMTGQRDEAAKTFTLRSEKDGFTAVCVQRFLDDDTDHWEWITKDKDGKVVFQQEGTNKRKK